jgi:arabinofuranosyltransferase
MEVLPVRWLANTCERHFGIACLLTWAAILALAWCNRFITDDAFIVFRYAEHLVHGQGLVFNPGERVEGYTCFLYVLLVAAGLRAGLDAITTSYVIGFLAATGTMYATFALATRLSSSRLIGLATAAILGTNYTFSAYVTGGLETQVHACLVTGFLALAVEEFLAERPGALRLVGCSLLASGAILTRPDSVALLAPMGVALLARTLASARPPGVKILTSVALIGPMVMIIGGWIVWKQGYYGSALPNTFYAKATPGTHLGRGVRYVYRFLVEYWLGPALVFVLWFWRDVIRMGRPASMVLLATLLLWTAYLLFVGGDFMEFRMFVPVLPIIAWFIVRTALALEEQAGLGLAFTALVLIGSLQHAVMYSRSPHPDAIQHTTALDPRLDPSMKNWVDVGLTLRRAFPGDSLPIIATWASGAVPYYSQAPTIDMVGLNDPWVARHGDRWSPAPGHERRATLDYLIARRVNFLIGNPWLVSGPIEDPVEIDTRNIPRFVAGEANGAKLPDGIRLVEIPIVPGRSLLAFYLVPTASVDRVIHEQGWRLHPIRIQSPPG